MKNRDKNFKKNALQKTMVWYENVDPAWLNSVNSKVEKSIANATSKFDYIVHYLYL